jgi:4-hydroxy-tetrahydrodipicolinate synthase
MRNDLKDRLTGVFVPIVTPMHPDRSLKTDAVPSLVDYLIEGGVSVIVPCGSTGEFASLTGGERQDMVRATVKAVDGRATVIAGVSDTRMSAVIELAEGAKEAGADGALVTAPYYFLASEDEVFDYFSGIDAAIDFPFLFYNNPATTKLNASFGLLDRLSTLRNFAGVKENDSSPVRYYEQLRLFGDRFPVIPAGEPPAVFNMLTGAPGFMSVAANFNPRLIGDILAAAQERRIEDAFALFEKLRTYRALFEARNRLGYPMYVVFAKTALNQLGFDVGAPRLPLREPARDDLERLCDVLRDVMDLPVVAEAPVQAAVS